MNLTEASIEIKRENNLIAVTVLMPTWNKVGDDGFINISIPLLGIQTSAKKQSDVEAATTEAMEIFFRVAEKHGKGIEKELELMGWKKTSQNLMEEFYNFNSNKKSNPMLDCLLQTGETSAHRMSIA